MGVNESITHWQDRAWSAERKLEQVVELLTAFRLDLSRQGAPALQTSRAWSELTSFVDDLGKNEPQLEQQVDSGIAKGQPKGRVVSLSATLHNSTGGPFSNRGRS